MVIDYYHSYSGNLLLTNNKQISTIVTQPNGIDLVQTQYTICS